MAGSVEPAEGQAVRQARFALSRASAARWDAEAALILARKRERDAQAALDAVLSGLGVGAPGGAGEGEAGGVRDADA